MRLGEKIKGFLKMSGHYAGSATYLAEHGYNDEYMRLLSEECLAAKNDRDRAEGNALTAQALMYRGQLKDALASYESTEIRKLPSYLNSVFVNNYIMCLFILGKKERILDIYEEYNSIALADSSLVMRRTIGIKEYIDKRYENAVTVFIKLVAEPDPRVTLMADICLVKSMLALDMNERAKEIAQLGFSRYTGKGDITAEVKKLEMKISGNMRKSGKSKKGGKKHG